MKKNKIFKILSKLGKAIMTTLVIFIITVFILWNNFVSKIDKPLTPSEKRAGQLMMERYMESQKINHKADK